MSACACWGEGGSAPSSGSSSLRGVPCSCSCLLSLSVLRLHLPNQPVLSAVRACSSCACVVSVLKPKLLKPHLAPCPPPLLIPRGFHERANRANPVRWLTVLCVHLQNCRFKLKKAPRAEMRERCEMLSFGGRQISRFMISFHGD